MKRPSIRAAAGALGLLALCTTAAPAGAEEAKTPPAEKAPTEPAKPKTAETPPTKPKTPVETPSRAAPQPKSPEPQEPERSAPAGSDSPDTTDAGAAAPASPAAPRDATTPSEAAAEPPPAPTPAPTATPAQSPSEPAAAGAPEPAATSPGVERYPVLRQPGADELRDRRPPPPSGPIDQPFNLAVNTDVVWNSSRGFDLFADNDLQTRVGLSAGYAIATTSRFSLVPALGWSTDKQHSSGLFGGALQSADLRAHDLYGSFALRYEVLAFLEPHARVAGGVSLTDVDLSFAKDAARFDTRSTGGFGTLGAGFTLKTPDRALQTSSGRLASLQLGVLVEGGYRLASKTTVKLRGSDENGLRIPVSSPTLGRLGTSGPYMRIALGGRF